MITRRADPRHSPRDSVPAANPFMCSPMMTPAPYISDPVDTSTSPMSPVRVWCLAIPTKVIMPPDASSSPMSRASNDPPMIVNARDTVSPSMSAPNPMMVAARVIDVAIERVLSS